MCLSRGHDLDNEGLLSGSIIRVLNLRYVVLFYGSSYLSYRLHIHSPFHFMSIQVERVVASAFAKLLSSSSFVLLAFLDISS